MIRVRHTVSGQIAEVPEHIFNHDILGRYLEEVDESAKPYVPELHTPRQADDFEEVEIDTEDLEGYAQLVDFNTAEIPTTPEEDEN